MQIYSIQSFRGKNIFSHKPVIKMVLNIGDLYNKPTKDLFSFNDKLLDLFPGLKKHCCSLGYEGGFVERLFEGTYIGHVTEHLVLELQSILGYEVYYGKTRLISEPSLYYIVYEYANEKCAIECGKNAVTIVSSLTEGKVPDIENIMVNLKKISIESDMGPSTKAIFDEAKRRGIPVTRIGNDSLIQLGYGKYSRMIEASLLDSTSCISVDIAGNKQLTKKILNENSIPVPEGDIAYTADSALEIALSIGFPVVLKPMDGNQGKGVNLGINNEVQLRAAYREANKYSKAVIVEKFITGRDYRILVVGDKVAAVSNRRPPFVTGDGIHTIIELVEIENKNPLRGDDHEKPLTKIKIDDAARLALKRNGVEDIYIPNAGENIFLRDNGNLSTGGTAKDYTERIHPYNCYMAVKAARAIGLDIAGIDMIIEDITVPISNKSGAIIEVNAAPGLRMHIYPTEGVSRNVAGDIIDMIYPVEQPYTIPIVSITGTNGKTTTTRLIRHTLSMFYDNVGMTSTSGIYIGSECIMKGDNTGPVSAGIILSNKKVDAAVLETARGGIVRKGLGYDLSDVGVVVNISEDHIGLDGLNSIEDLAFVKSLVVEAVKPKGFVVLNADDSMTDYFIKRAAGSVVLFSKYDTNPLIKKQIESGFTAVYVSNNRIMVSKDKQTMLLLSIEEIPITFGGIVECNVENSLAAVGALFSLNIPISIIKKGLKTFKPDIDGNPGRFNIFNMGEFRVMLDYCHNTAGYISLIKFIRKSEATRLVGIIGMPGDRLDKNIKEVGESCAKAFSKIYIKEDNDLRGRDPGEVAGILYDSAIKSGALKENIEIVFSEVKALECAMLDAKPGDLIVMLYEEFDPAVEFINKFKDEIDNNIILQLSS